MRNFYVLKGDGMIVNLWERVFNILRWVSVFQFIIRINPNLKNHEFVDKWVLGNFLFSFLSMILAKYTPLKELRYFLLIYGFLRVFEVFVYQVNVLLFDQYNARNYSIKSYRRTVILLFHNFVEIIFWFTTSYLILEDNFNQKLSLIESLYLSFVTMTTFGTTNISFKTNIGMMVIWFQSIIGLFMTLISLARFISLLPTPISMDDRENQMEKRISSKKHEN